MRTLPLRVGKTLVLGAMILTSLRLVSEAQTVTLDFTSVTLPPGGCTDATAYLATFGITFVPDTPGATAQICNAAGSAIHPTSSPNFFFIGPPVTNTNVSGDLVFSTPVAQISFTTTAVDPGTSVPAWDAEAFNASNTQLSSASEPSLFPGPGALSFTLPGPGITRLHFDAFNSAARTYNFPPIDHFTLMEGCVNQGDVRLFPGTPFSRDGKPLSMNATFAPTDVNGAPVALTVQASSCGFTGFNWQQQVVSLPSPSPFFPVQQTDVMPANLAPDGSLKAPPSYLDPPPEGYILEAPNGTFQLQPDNANPYFLSASDLGPPVGFFVCNPGQPIPAETTDALNFQDCPGDYALPNGAAIQFQTSLVGVCGAGATAAVCNGLPSGYPSPPLFTWNWSTTFNGTSKKNPSTGTGGVAQLKSVFPIDPNSGTGGVTITSLNGVPQTPPSVTCTATPSTLWPPNGKSVPVTVSGAITAGTQAIPASGTTFAVVDEYAQVQPTGSITVGAGGSYSFTVSLIASRNGNDPDGRTYTIEVFASDAIGNLGSCQAVVTVPHDQGH